MRVVDARRRRDPADLRRRGRRPDGHRLRPVRARPGARRRSPRTPARDPTRRDGDRAVRLAGDGARLDVRDARRPATRPGPGRRRGGRHRTRWSPGRSMPIGRSGWRRGSGSATTWPTAAATTPVDARLAGHPRRVRRHRPGARRPGQRRHRARTVVAAGAASATGRPRSRPRILRADRRRPPTIRRRGGRRSTSRPTTVAGAAPLGIRATAPRRPALVPRRRRGRVPRPVQRRGPPSRARLGRAGRPRHRGRRPRPRGPRAGRGRLRPGDAAPVRDQGRRVDGCSRRSSPARPCSSTPPDDSPRDPTPRATMGLVMGDLVPARRALDPRFLAAVLRP